jgi:hypothetical protein
MMVRHSPFSDTGHRFQSESTLQDIEIGEISRISISG